MHTALIAVLMVALFAAGIWLGVSGLMDQYAVDTSGSQASSSAACIPAKTPIAIGEPVTFTLNLTDVPVLWTATEGRMQWIQPGRPQFMFSTPGEKTAYALVGTGPSGLYSRIPCSVTVR